MTDIPENIDFSEHGVALWRSSFKGIYTDWEEGDFGCGACLAPRHIYKLTSSEILSVFIRVIRGQKDLKPILPRVNGEEGDEEQQQGDADQGGEEKLKAEIGKLKFQFRAGAHFVFLLSAFCFLLSALPMRRRRAVRGLYVIR